jgi:hypothetical protein
MIRAGKICIFLLILSTSLYSQDLQYYIPAGFINPLLKSGEFVSSLYYFHDQIQTEQDISRIKYSRRDINFLGYLGITDKITLKTRFIISPPQTIQEVIEGGIGEKTSNFSFSPEITFSYRPISNIEIFSSVYYSDQTNQIGEQGYYGEVPVGVDSTGNVIYERRLVTQSAQPDLNSKNTTFFIGFSYIGKLW